MNPYQLLLFGIAGFLLLLGVMTEINSNASDPSAVEVPSVVLTHLSCSGETDDDWHSTIDVDADFNGIFLDAGTIDVQGNVNTELDHVPIRFGIFVNLEFWASLHLEFDQPSLGSYPFRKLLVSGPLNHLTGTLEYQPHKNSVDWEGKLPQQDVKQLNCTVSS